MQERVVSSLSVRALVAHLLPGLGISFELYFYFAENFDKAINSFLVRVPGFQGSLVFQSGLIFLFILASLGIGIFLETIRVTFFPWLLPFKRVTSGKLFADEHEKYDKLFDRIFLGGNFSYNMTIPALFNPIPFLALMSCGLAVTSNMIVAWFFSYLGLRNEKKFYRLTSPGSGTQTDGVIRGILGSPYYSKLVAWVVIIVSYIVVAKFYLCDLK